MYPSTCEVIVLCWKAPASSEINARKIAEFLGAKVTFVSLATTAVPAVKSISRLIPSCSCLIAHVDTLAQLADATKIGVDGLRGLIDLAEHTFVYGFRPTDRHSSILRILSSGGLLGAQQLEVSATTFGFADGHREWCGQFSGLSFSATDSRRGASFVQGMEQGRQAVLIRAGGKPFFVRVEYGKADLFFLACGELADLEEKIPGETGLLPWVPRLVPLMMFLRGALGTRVWHNDHPRACFIIDDPLLKNRHGFLEYRRLFETVRHQRFSTCIAFIPWNYRRSQKKIAELFATDPTITSLCVHGCDHTGAEFGTTSFESLCGKAQLALDRMQEHHRLSGVPFDEVMVFPQGIFSFEALKALKACGYLAAVNSSLYPSDMRGTLALRDLLEVALTRFAGFPLFGRRYPKDPVEFAFDLFLGKPALAVEHHGYFRNGYEGLEAFVARLNALDARLEWANLATILSRACLTRMAENGDVHVRFYTNRFGLKNYSTHSQKYLLIRQRQPEEPPSSATVNGRNGDCQQDNDTLTIAVSLEAGQTADIRISTGSADPIVVRSPRPRTGHNARVLVRRLLCEFRDNHVDTNRILSGMVSGVRKLVRKRRLQEPSVPVRDSHLLR